MGFVFINLGVRRPLRRFGKAKFISRQEESGGGPPHSKEVTIGLRNSGEKNPLLASDQSPVTASNCF